MNLTKYLAPAALLGALLVPTVAQAYPGQHPAPIDQRLQHQHARIENGIHSGELTRGEAHRLESRDRQVAHQDRRDRRFDHGHLTYGERRHQEHELNHDSKAIYRLKHNDHFR